MGTAPAHDAVLTAYAKSLIQIKARQLSHKAGFNRSDEDDLRQELTMHLLRQAHRFDPGRASVNTFIARVVGSYVVTLLRRRARSKRAPGYFTQSLDQPVGNADGKVAVLRDRLSEADLGRRTGRGPDNSTERRDLADAVSQAIASLPVELQDICSRLGEGTIASVARDLGVSRCQVAKAIARIREHFRASGLEVF